MIFSVLAKIHTAEFDYWLGSTCSHPCHSLSSQVFDFLLGMSLNFNTKLVENVIIEMFWHLCKRLQLSLLVGSLRHKKTEDAAWINCKYLQEKRARYPVIWLTKTAAILSRFGKKGTNIQILPVNVLPGFQADGWDFLTGSQQYCCTHREPVLTPHCNVPHSHLFPMRF